MLKRVVKPPLGPGTALLPETVTPALNQNPLKSPGGHPPPTEKMERQDCAARGALSSSPGTPLPMLYLALVHVVLFRIS